jgi:hypothetical protein
MGAHAAYLCNVNKRKANAMSYSLDANAPIRALIFNPSPVIDQDLASNGIDALDSDEVNSAIGEFEYDEDYLVKVSAENEDPRNAILVDGVPKEFPVCFPCLSWNGAVDGKVTLIVSSLFGEPLGTFRDLVDGAVGEYVKQFEKRFKTTLKAVQTW